MASMPLFEPSAGGSGAIFMRWMLLSSRTQEDAQKMIGGAGFITGFVIAS